MRSTVLLVAIVAVAGCGGGSSTTVGPSSVPGGDNGGGNSGGGPDGGTAMPDAGSDGGNGSGGGGGDMAVAGGTDGGVTACAPATTEQLPFGGSSIAVDDTTIYYNRWTGKLGPDTLFARNKDLSGSERQLAIIDNGGTRAHLLVDANYVWAISVGCPLRISKSGGSSTSLGCTNQSFLEYAQDDAAIFGTTTDGGVFRIAKSDGTLTALSTGHQLVHGLAVASGFVYFAGDGHILRVPVGGGTVENIVQNAAGATELAADDGHVYYGDGAGRIWSAPTTPGATATQRAMVGLGVTLMASDATRLYWAAQQDANDSVGQHFIDAIEEMGKDGSGLRQLEPRVVGIHTLALDDARVYWTDGSAARVCK